MATKKFTDGPGLAYAFSKIKALIGTKANADLSNVDSTVLKTAVENSGAGVTVDSALSSTSTNPVQNKVVQAALDAKAAKDLTNVENAALAKKAVEAGIVGPIVNAESADGVAYTATVEGVTELYDGLKIRILPQVVSASTSPTLDVNGLGAIRIGMLSTFNNAAVVPAPIATWLSAMRPLTVTFHQMRSSATGEVTLQYWIVDWRRPSATSLYGDVVQVETKTLSTTWTEDEETGVKTQTVSITGVTADDTANVDVYYNGDGTSDSYATFVEQQNQFLDFITNGFAETVEGGIKFTIFGDPNTVSIPIIVEVI